MTDRDKLIEAMARAFDVSPFFAGVGLRRLEARGLAVVPVDPTEAMVKAAHRQRPYREDGDYDTDYDANTEMTWNAMIQAARGGV